MFSNYVGRLEREQLVPRPRGEVFSFFSDARNLEAMTPAFLKFHILTPPPIVMRPGLVIDYELRLFGIRFHWQTKITEFEPESRFVDVQAKGPYRRWHHVHEFRDVPGGTLVVDRVDYEMPLGPLGRLVHALSVSRSLRQIFDYRAQKLAQLYGPALEPAAAQAPP